ncbi:MAG: AraC family transcriptional regulator [Candidatus Marinimicrobia bacterium]|nr:AraC family transcriptional regulator [Candidatus Neomarinimicrobiota bacterium]
MAPHPISTGIFIFNDVEVLDFTGPFEVFSTTRRESNDGEEFLYRVHLISPTDASIITRGGMEVKPHCSMKSHPDLDMLIVPGGCGTRPLMHDGKVIDWLHSLDTNKTRLASVCTGSLLLAAAGHLDGRRATTHWTVLDMMEKTFPKVDVDRERHVIVDEAVFTSAGISAGIDLALQMVRLDFGDAQAEWTARHMEYSFVPDDFTRRLDLSRN